MTELCQLAARLVEIPMEGLPNMNECKTMDEYRGHYFEYGLVGVVLCIVLVVATNWIVPPFNSYLQLGALMAITASFFWRACRGSH